MLHPNNNRSSTESVGQFNQVAQIYQSQITTDSVTSPSPHTQPCLHIYTELLATIISTHIVQYFKSYLSWFSASIPMYIQSPHCFLIHSLEICALSMEKALNQAIVQKCYTAYNYIHALRFQIMCTLKCMRIFRHN